MQFKFLMLLLCYASMAASQSFSFGFGFDNPSPLPEPFSTFSFQSPFTSSSDVSRGASSRTAPGIQGEVPSTQSNPSPARESISSFVFSALDDHSVLSNQDSQTVSSIPGQRSVERPRQQHLSQQSRRQPLAQLAQQVWPPQQQADRQQQQVWQQPQQVQRSQQQPQRQRQEQTTHLSRSPVLQQEQNQQQQDQHQLEQQQLQQQQLQQQEQLKQQQNLQKQQQEQQREQLRQLQSLLNSKTSRLTQTSPQQRRRTHETSRVSQPSQQPQVSQQTTFQQQPQHAQQQRQRQPQQQQQPQQQTFRGNMRQTSAPAFEERANEITSVAIGKSPCTRGTAGHECRMQLMKNALTCPSGKCNECQQCGSLAATEWVACCRDHFLCCRPLARSCQRCDQPQLEHFCNIAFGKC